LYSYLKCFGSLVTTFLNYCNQHLHVPRWVSNARSDYLIAAFVLRARNQAPPFHLARLILSRQDLDYHCVIHMKLQSSPIHLQHESSTSRALHPSQPRRLLGPYTPLQQHSSYTGL
jgi:hypothetical protein